MARPQKKGLEYFPLDVDMDSDEKVAYVIAKYEFTAFGLLVKLYMEIYRRGYFLVWDERQMYLLKHQLKLDADYVNSVVLACVEGEIFDETLFRKYGVLTSHGIQQRYLQATGRRVSVKMAPEICLLDAEEIKTAKVEFVASKLVKKEVSDAETPISDNRNIRKQEENSIPTASEQKPQFPHTETPVSVEKTDFFQKSEVDENKQKTVSDAETPVSAYRNPVSDDITSAESTQSKVKYIIDDDDKGRGKNDSDKQFAEIAKTFSDNIHPISGEIEKDKLTDLYEHYGYKWCMEAIKETALNHGRSIKYIERVLDDWERNGFKAPKPKAEKGGAKRGGNGGNSRTAKVEGIDDFREAERRQRANRPWDVQPDPGGVETV